MAFPTRRRTALAALMCLALVLSGCADFSAQDHSADAGTFTSEPDGPHTIAPPPTTPSDDDGGDPPTGPCVDKDAAVIATCLASTSGVRPASADGRSTYVAERATGKIIISKRYGPQRVIATVPVDGSGDGGLIDFELSPTYDQDQMIYALISTGSDNRIVRIAPGDSVKPILTGIPKGATGNMGSISFTSPTELRVATGDAGNPASADDRGSLAGKIFTIDPTTVDPKPRILATGLGSNVALCPDPENGKLYVADSGANGDRLSVVEPSGLRKLWSWADRPGLTGCATGSSWIAVSIASKRRIDVLAKPTDASPSIGEPSQQDYSKTYGAIGRMTTFGGAAMQIATINKSTPRANVVSTDDRVAIVIPNQSNDDNT
ncbi:MAG: PQQ-dependent sugar dehydrogenase [Gordonia sp. (in: high G+C Gram-positive bacteria)]